MNIIWVEIPHSGAVLAGLMSSSMNRGSRTDTGLGRSCLSPDISEASAVFVVQQLGGDSNEGGG